MRNLPSAAECWKISKFLVFLKDLQDYTVSDTFDPHCNFFLGAYNMKPSYVVKVGCLWFCLVLVHGGWILWDFLSHFRVLFTVPSE